MSWTVYEHWSPSGKVYVGITSQSIKVRWQNGNGYIKCKTFYRAIRKYGWENMKHIIVSSNLGEKTAKNIEIDLIRFYKNRGISYNITDGGEGSLGRVPTQKQRNKVGNIWRGKNIPLEVRMKMSISHLGRHNTKEHNTNISKSKIGNTNRSKVVFQYDLHGRVVSRYNSAKEAANVIGVSPNTISKACKGLLKSLRGFIFMYECCRKESLYKRS